MAGKSNTPQKKNTPYKKRRRKRNTQGPHLGPTILGNGTVYKVVPVGALDFVLDLHCHQRSGHDGGSLLLYVRRCVTVIAFGLLLHVFWVLLPVPGRMIMK